MLIQVVYIIRKSYINIKYIAKLLILDRIDIYYIVLLY